MADGRQSLLLYILKLFFKLIKLQHYAVFVNFINYID